MNIFMTLSSPHLGYIYYKNSFVGAGIWLIKKWKNTKSLNQLTLEDSKNIKNTLLYKLSNS